MNLSNFWSYCTCLSLMGRNSALKNDWANKEEKGLAPNCWSVATDGLLYYNPSVMLPLTSNIISIYTWRCRAAMWLRDTHWVPAKASGSQGGQKISERKGNFWFLFCPHWWLTMKSKNSWPKCTWDLGGVEAGSLGNVSVDIDKERGTFDLTTMAFRRIPLQGMLVGTDVVASVWTREATGDCGGEVS